MMWVGTLEHYGVQMYRDCSRAIWHHDLPEYGSPKPPMFPEAEVLHVLDLLDARMFEMNRELKNAQPGGFTERIWSLERKLYRRKEPPRARPQDAPEGPES